MRQVLRAVQDGRSSRFQIEIGIGIGIVAESLANRAVLDSDFDSDTDFDRHDSSV